MVQRYSPSKKRTPATGVVGLLVLVFAVCLVYALAWRGDGSRRTRRTTELAHLPRCPVGGMSVNFAVSSQTNDGPVFFCCEHCIDRFNTNPPDYAEGVRVQREFLAKMPKIQVRCPVSGEPVSAEIVVESGDETVYFCGEKCRIEYREDPSQYGASLLSSYS